MCCAITDARLYGFSQPVTHGSAKLDNSVLLLLLKLQQEIQNENPSAKLVNIQKPPWGGRKVLCSLLQTAAITTAAPSIQAAAAI